MTESGNDFWLEQKTPHGQGTTARMSVRLTHTRTLQQVFEEFQDEDLVWEEGGSTTGTYWATSSDGITWETSDAHCPSGLVSPGQPDGS